MKSKRLAVGILAHVDSGKTTLAEAILYLCGAVRTLGRVDHKDAFFDDSAIERDRGITVFSKQAQIRVGSMDICLLDTPGHVDFSAEMERTLQILDYALLVVSASDGVQAHTLTLWQLLKRYGVPTFVFANKMDMAGADKDKLVCELQSKLDSRLIDFNEKDRCILSENIALCDEGLLEIFSENGVFSNGEISEAIAGRRVFPCFFGSALKLYGVNELLEGMEIYMEEKEYPEEFSARVFKITRDERNSRITHMKIMGGKLRAKDILGEGEKVDQIRIYQGNHYIVTNEAEAGAVCAVAGLEHTFAGEGLGVSDEDNAPLLEPVLNYTLELPIDCDVYGFYLKLCAFCEEYPELMPSWNEKSGQIQIQVMGAVQLEVLKKLIQERYGVNVNFGHGKIVYKETIAAPVIGIGHFEPLRHYAEVHLLLEPLDRGSGIELAVACEDENSDKTVQRLILSCLEDKKHLGVLTGSEITDVRITLIALKSHEKHTEGGDFRQAANRAVRQGLKFAESILLEPVYDFRLEVPRENVGRAISDIQRRGGRFETPSDDGKTAFIIGRAPVAQMQNYQMEVASYTKGLGHFACVVGGYEECKNADEVIGSIGYDSENDVDNPTGSIFCAHGAGFYVPWDEVAEHAHIQYNDSAIKNENDCISQHTSKALSDFDGVFIAQEEIDEIFKRTFGNAGKKRNGWGKRNISPEAVSYKGKSNPSKYGSRAQYLIVDGYNIIFSWDELRELAKTNIDSARDALMDIMCNYQGYKKIELILVFDAYKVHGGKGEAFDYRNIHIVYTKEAETADQYIEKITHDMAGQYQVTVATSDRFEQMVVWGQGAIRMSAQEFKSEVEAAEREIRERIGEHGL